MAKTKKARIGLGLPEGAAWRGLTKGEQLIREALTSQGRPLPGTPEDAAWIRGRDYGEKRALEKARAQPLPAASPKPRDVGPTFSRTMALHWLEGLDGQFGDIAALAITGLAYQETRADDYKDPVTCSLLEIIQQQADNSVDVSKELQKMLEALPEGGKS